MTPAAESSADGLNAGRYRLPGSHRLKHRRLIRSLFDRSAADVRQVSSGAIRAVFRFVPLEDYPDLTVNVQVGFFVGRKVGGAVVRNKVRRRMREAYRMYHRDVVMDMSGRQCVLVLGLIFRGRTKASWPSISGDVSNVVRNVLDIVQQRNGASPAPASFHSG